MDLGTAVNVWPTPHGMGKEGPRRPGPSGNELGRAVNQWATPKASPSGPDFARVGRDGSGGDDLATQVARCATPTTQDSANTGGPSQHRRNSVPLNAQVHLAQYPTPSATTYGSSGNGSGNNVASRSRPSLETMARTDSWPTPRTADGRGSTRNDTLPGAIKGRESWPTPTAGDSRGSGSRNTEHSKAHAGVSLTDAVRGDGGTGRQEQAEKPAPLNPAWVCWLMGWPEKWTSLDPMSSEDLAEWACRVLSGEQWAQDPAEVGTTPRTARDVPNRVAQLRAIGNGQVSLSFVAAWIGLEPNAGGASA